jgi:hypothetical protein
VLPGGLAAESGKFASGDRIVSVNDIDFSTLLHADAGRILAVCIFLDQFLLYNTEFSCRRPGIWCLCSRDPSLQGIPFLLKNLSPGNTPVFVIRQPKASKARANCETTFVATGGATGYYRGLGEKEYVFRF